MPEHDDVRLRGELRQRGQQSGVMAFAVASHQRGICALDQPRRDLHDSAGLRRLLAQQPSRRFKRRGECRSHADASPAPHGFLGHGLVNANHRH
jgi:hypothetical protein